VRSAHLKERFRTPPTPGFFDILHASFGNVLRAMEILRRIRERAYQLWEQEGRPQGRHLDHWLQAEHEVIAENAMDFGFKQLIKRQTCVDALLTSPGAGSANSSEQSRIRRTPET